MDLDTVRTTAITTRGERAGAASPIRWAGLAGREHGPGARGDSFVFLHGLTFDRRMWDSVLEALPADRRALAFDLPGHGGSPALASPGLAPVVDALHEAVLAAGIAEPIMVGHSIGGPIATIYAATYPAAGVVSVDAPLRLEPFAALLHSLRPQLVGAGFAEVWARFRESFQMHLLPAERRAFLREHPTQQLVLSYQADLLERPLADVVAWRDDGLRRLRDRSTPYISLHANEVEPAERAWLGERLPQAESIVWPVRHHFPHLAEPGRFAALLAGFAAGLGGGER